jgi:NADPH:quinone reductase-like Zn-dependent oxidoreductase
MSFPAVMQAAFVRAPGPAESIEFGTLPVPRPGPTDVLVRVEATAVNHVDLFVRSGAYATHTPYPFIIGRDLVGTVADVGSGVTDFAPGDRVWCNSLGHGGRQGSFAGYAVVATERLYHLPADVDPRSAAPVLHTAATAHIGLFREARLAPGETVLVGGAGGGVGSAVVQLARAAGARVIATASAQDAQWCRSCGAHEVLDYRNPGLADTLRQVHPEGFDVWWDNSGTHDFETVLPLLRKGGRVIVLAGLAARPVLPVGQLYTRDASLRGFAISNASVADLARAADTVNRLLKERRLQSRVCQTFPLEKAAEAHRLMEVGTQGGRILVIP